MTLQQIRKALINELNSVDARRAKLQTAIKALGGGAKLGRPPGKRKPHFSAKARAAIAKAQRARWAKIKAAQAGK